MSKKDFIALADELRGPLGDLNDGETKIEKALVIGHLCRFMARSNSQFKEPRWRDYLAGKVGPNGGELKPEKPKAYPRPVPTLGPCACRRGIERDNCAQCEGTGRRIDFAALRAS